MSNAIETAVSTYIDLNNVTFSHNYGGVYTSDNWEHFKWVVTFAKVDPSRYYSGFPVVVAEESFCYRMGMAHSTKDKYGNVKPTAPTAASVLHSLLLDADAAETSFEYWCADYGFDTDSRKALQTYLECQETAGKLAKIFTSQQIDALREMMQDY